MGSCNYQNDCRFYRKYSQVPARDDANRPLYDQYCATGRTEDCAIHLHVRRKGTPPPRSLLPDGSRYIDASTLRLLAAAALVVTFLACLTVIFAAVW